MVSDKNDDLLLIVQFVESNTL